MYVQELTSSERLNTGYGIWSSRGPCVPSLSQDERQHRCSMRACMWTHHEHPGLELRTQV